VPNYLSLFSELSSLNARTGATSRLELARGVCRPEAKMIANPVINVRRGHWKISFKTI
jgi:hypothetical protein